nr:alpha/beta hydrolase [Aeoliella straminimaris]
MLLIHGNGASIRAMGYQIACFSPNYQVIVADSRGHGQSEMGPGTLTYEQMAEDANALLDHLALEKVAVLGWSDGGNIGLLLAMHHPEKVSKLAIMGSNLHPLGAHQYAFDSMTAVEQEIDEMIAMKDDSEPWEIKKQHVQLCTKHPHIQVGNLKRIAAPTLVMAADRDVIRNAHTLEIFEGIPSSQLCIFPGATHMIPWEDPTRFNDAAKRFFDQPFARPDTKQFFEEK